MGDRGRTQPFPSPTKLVVVVDDDRFVLEAMGGLLRKWGYEVLTATTDRAALAQLAERRRAPDLIVCDYHLSDGATGVEAIERLRGALPIPALLITSDAMAAETVQASAHDIHVVRKPANVKVLRALLRQVLSDPARGR